MNHWREKIYNGYNRIQMIGNTSSTVSAFCERMSIDKSRIQFLDSYDYLYSSLHQSTADLMVINLDHHSVDEVSYLVFLTACFAPSETPVVLISRKEISNQTRNEYLSKGVLEVIQVTDTSARQVNPTSKHRLGGPLDRKG